MASKMRMFFPYPGRRKVQNESQVTFKKSKEFKLREYVIAGSKNKHTPCLFEMSLVFTCLKESKFNEKLCGDEVQKFNNCYLAALKESGEMKEKRKNPTKMFGSDNLFHFQINEMLQKYKFK